MIEGPKKVNQILERFTYMYNVNITKIKCETEVLYDVNSKKNIYIDQYLESIPPISKNKDPSKQAYELYISAVDKDELPCEVCRVKYVSDSSKW